MDALLQNLAETLELVFIPILLLEIVWLHRRGDLSWKRGKEMLGSASAVLFLVPAAIVGVFAWLAVFGWISDLLPWSIPTTWVTAILAILATDFIYYWAHRIEHECRLPWALYHSVHHSSPSFDQTTSLRLGIFDGLLAPVFYTPLVLIGFSPLIVVAAVALVVAYQTWIHTELIRKLPRWFEAVFNTPSHHRGHHGADAHYLDRNYGAVLIVWDRLFGTFQPETTRPTYGLTTQIDSSNPFDVQFSQLRLLWRDLRTDRSWKVRFQHLWRGPSWEPAAPETATAGSVLSR